MGIYDDMFEMDAHFKSLVKNPDKISTASKKERKGLEEAWKRITESHADYERYQMKASPIISAVRDILDAFGVQREIKP